MLDLQDFIDTTLEAGAWPPRGLQIFHLQRFERIVRVEQSGYALRPRHGFG
jgi:hypothetical protein